MSHIDSLNASLAPAAPPEVAPAAASTKPGEDFSSFFAEAITRTLTENTLTGLNGAVNLPSDDSKGYLQSMLLSDVAGGQADGSEILLYMLLCMMQEFKGCDIAPLMTAMSALLPGSNPASFNPNSYNPLSYIPGSNVSSAYNPAFLPEKAWLPTSFTSVSSAGNRSAAALNRVISQFRVESTERYRPNRNGKTYCNIFVWDVTRALGCEIPHYVERQSGDPRYYPNTTGAYELDANGTADWLKQRGADYGWIEISATEAQQYANVGFPVVSAWRSGGNGPGHVQIVCPSRSGDYDPKHGVTVAQAGSRNFTYAYIKDTMSADKIAQTRYYVHE